MSITENEFARLPGDLQRKDPDVVKVVRCGKCLYGEGRTEGTLCSLFGCYMGYDMFCSYGRSSYVD